MDVLDRFDIHKRQRSLELAIDSIKSACISGNNKDAIHLRNQNLERMVES